MDSFADQLYRLGQRLDEQLARARLDPGNPPPNDPVVDYELISELPASISTLSESELKSVFSEAARRGDVAVLQQTEAAWSRKLFSAGLTGAIAAKNAEILLWLLDGGAEISFPHFRSAVELDDLDTLEIIFRKISSSHVLALFDGKFLEISDNYKTREFLRSRHVLALAGEAQDKYKQGEYEKSGNFYSQALAICGEHGNRAKLMYNLARALYRQGRYVQTVQHCSDSLSLDPSYLNSYRCRAHAYLGLLDFDRAQADLDVCRESVRLPPLDPLTVLDISAGSETQIRAAFREKARKFHPDKYSGASEEVKARCANFFPKIQQAYEALLTGAAGIRRQGDLCKFLDSPDDGGWTPDEFIAVLSPRYEGEEQENRDYGRMSVSGNKFDEI